LGQKVHPIGFRLGINKDWQTRWFAGRDSDYAAQVREDLLIRNLLNERLADAAVSRVEIERKPPNEVVVTIHTARPGVAIGRYADPDEVAVVVTYLCSEENTYTVGAVWRVAGTAG